MHPNVSAAVSRGAADLIYVDVNAVNSAGGWPHNDLRRFAFPDVSDAIRYHPQPHLIDAVLVDGRFRAASIIKAASVVRDDTPIFIHDANRAEYLYPITAGVVRIVEHNGDNTFKVLMRTPFAAELDARPNALAAWTEVWSPVDYPG